MTKRIIKTLVYALWLSISIRATPAAAPKSLTLSLEQQQVDISLSWPTVTGVTGYRLYYAPYPAATPIQAINLPLANSLDLALNSGDAFYAAITAYNTDGESPYSNVVTLDLAHKVTDATELKLNSILNELSIDTDIPGAIALVALPDGAVWKKAAGFADLQQSIPMRPNHQFRIGSTTKIFIATLVLQLMEENQLNLENTIDQYLPAKIVDNIARIDSISYGDKITLRQLLRHESGIFDYARDDKLLMDVQNDLQRIWQPEEILAYVYKQEPYFIPGTPGQGHYSNTNYLLLGLILESILQQPIAKTLQERIFTPLNLTHTLFEYDDTLTPNIATGYRNDVPTTDFSPSLTWTAGAIVSDTEDLRRFINQLFLGRLFQKKETLNTMLEFNQHNFGLGIKKADLSPKIGTVYYHNGNTPGFLTVAAYIPTKQQTIVLSLNQGESEEVAQKFFEALIKIANALP